MRTTAAVLTLFFASVPCAVHFAQSGLLTSAFEAKLVASDAAASDEFGTSIALDGDTAVVGAPYDSHPSSPSAGSVYVYVRTGASWSEQAHLVAMDALGSDFFGSTVAIAGDTLVVGAYNEDLPGKSNAGAVYVFVRSGTTWTQQAKVAAADPSANDLFGRAVAVAGDTLLVGADYDDHAAAVEAGSVYVFVRSGASWSQQAKLVASDAKTDARFGNSVSLSGETAAIGAPYAEPGAAYVFTRSGTSWSQQAKLSAAAIGTTQFAHSVSIAGDLLLAGMVYADLPGAPDAGAAYVFARNGTSWTQKVKLVAPDAGDTDGFAWSAALSGDTAVLGALQEDQGGTNAGAAYAFRIVACPASFAAAEVVRVGDPPNPPALLHGQSSAPVAGATWDPVIDHASFVPGALIDVLVLTAEPANRPSAIGTVLCDLSKPALYFTALPGAPFALALPSDCALVGTTWTVQGASNDAASLALTNALDIVVGSF